MTPNDGRAIHFRPICRHAANACFLESAANGGGRQTHDATPPVINVLRGLAACIHLWAECLARSRDLLTLFLSFGVLLMRLTTAHNGYADAPPRRTLLLLLANLLDCELLTEWCDTHIVADQIDSRINLEDGLVFCAVNLPRLVVLDPTIGAESIAKSISALRNSKMLHLLVLDRRPSEGCLVEILTEPSASYLSRQAGQGALAAGIAGILAEGRRVFDISLTQRLRDTEHGYSLDKTAMNGSIVALSARERRVMQLLAEGRSVRQCAADLGIAQSTVDNHKSRLMKKLGIHKASELTRLAIREGLVVA